MGDLRVTKSIDTIKRETVREPIVITKTVETEVETTSPPADEKKKDDNSFFDPMQGAITGNFINLDGNPFTEY